MVDGTLLRLSRTCQRSFSPRCYTAEASVHLIVVRWIVTSSKGTTVIDSCQIGRLANGLSVVTTPLPTSQAASVSLFIGAGSRAEEEQYNGLFHYLEHMLFKGTERRPDPIEIGQAIEAVGGTLNAYTTKEMTCYWNRVPFDQLDLAVDVLADMLQHSLLAPEELERERSVVQQEIRRGHDQPGQWAGELLSRAAYGDTPIGRSIAGTVETVQNLGRDDFVTHMQRWYLPSRIVLSVAGNVDHERVMALAERLFAGLPDSAPSSFVPAPEVAPEQRVLVESREIEQCNLALAFRALARQDPDRYPLLVLNSVLGRGMSSRLFREVRERRGLAYSVGSGVSRHLDTGLLSVSAGVSNEKAAEAIQVILQECYRLVDEPVGEEELRKAKDFAIGNFRLGLETAMALGQRAGELLLLDGEIEPVEDVVARIRAVTPEDVQRVARRVIRPETAALSAVGRVEGEELEATLAAAA
ncbi:MAG TPA: pitrilysin family protein [Dehalococcoidia bacterium]|nr:pitrilysin family protein [Dehalococcoidia bacterium]